MLKYGLYPLDFKFPYKFALGEENWTDEQKENSRIPINRLFNDVLLGWINKYIDPKLWVIEITGGEPLLYEEIYSLLYDLCETKGFTVILKTNGSFHTPKLENLTVVSSWHCEEDNPPLFYDIIIILRDETDRHIKKIEYCKNNKIPYFVQWLDHLREEKELVYLKDKVNHFIHCTHVNASGDITACSGVSPKNDDKNKNESIFKNHPPILKNNSLCPNCHNQIMVEVFLPEKIKKKVKEDYDNEVKKQKLNRLNIVC